MIRVSICTLRNQSQDVSENLIHQWTSEMKETKKIVDKLEGVKNKIVDEQEKRSQRYEETKKQL